jgi:Zn-dependent dipeptidase, microsomal dipeptidase homolog
MNFDAHSDIWTDVNIKSLAGERDIIRKYHIDRLRKGEIEGSIFVVWVDPPYTDDPKKRTAQAFEAIRKEAEDCADIAVICRNYAEIEKAKAEGRLYIIVGMEGISGLAPDVSEIDRVYELGTRHIFLTWNEANDFATGVRGPEDRGLTEIGKDVVKRILGKNMMLDVSHLNEKSFWDVIDMADVPLVASHSNARALCDVPRNLKDEQLRAIAELNGVVGLNAFNEFIDTEKEKRTADRLVEHAVYIADKIGIDHVGFGFDFDEFLPADCTSDFHSEEAEKTIGLENCTDIPSFVDKLEKAGFKGGDLEKITHGNFLRVIRERLG